jgi:nucleotide-binding universal stress UspA family protein
MFDVRRILCPVDFSEFSRRALHQATRLARWYGAELHVLHVRTPPVGGPLLPSGLAPAAGALVAAVDAPGDLAAFVAPAHAVNVAVKTHVAEGDPEARILELARQAAVDIVVMGTHGRGGFERLMLGSAAESMLRRAPCPVLTTCRADAPFLREGPPFRSLLCPIDFSPSSLDALDLALSLAAEGDAHLTLLHVMEPLAPDRLGSGIGVTDDDARREREAEATVRLRRALPARAGDWCRPRAVLAVGDFRDEALRVAQDYEADLIVMGVHGRNALDLALFGSNTRHLVRAASCPVLTVRQTVPAAPRAAVREGVTG